MKMETSSLKNTDGNQDEDLSGIPNVLKYTLLGAICLLAFLIRLFAVVRYESVIHEFDPYFNFRTTKYLASEGFLEFLNWFDDRGWYPLGRTIGGTIYPGLMLTAASLYWVLNALNISVNIRNVCVFLAPIFSANAALSSFLLTTEVTKKSSAGLLAAAFTAIVPSYISRSVGGSYDNEGVAIFALIFCFYLWVKSVNTGSIMWATLCAVSYYYMVAAWGGYVFIINIIPIYTALMIVGGRYSSRLYIAYSIFYTLGSLMAMTVPFVGFNVINQAECAASHGVFIMIQSYALLILILANMNRQIIQKIFILVALVGVSSVAAYLIYLQYEGKLTWTGRSLTLLDPTYASKYIPIIASVSEHQPTAWTSFFFDLHILVPFSSLGLFVLYNKITDGGIFIILYGTIAWYFAGIMVRLMLTLAPIACILSGIGLSAVITRFAAVIKLSFSYPSLQTKVSHSQQQSVPKNDVVTEKSVEDDNSLASSSMGESTSATAVPSTSLQTVHRSLSPGFSFLIIVGITSLLLAFTYHASYVSSVAYSSPSVVIEAGRTRDGQRVIHDDYREAYFWLRMNTNPQAKILSWWDYGYQMSAMANRTVLVDNNTWNNTHIATVGRALASTEEKAYPIFESLDVDYVLVIFGGLTGYSSDDINKFLWPVRIGSGVYPNDMPKEKDFYSSQGFDIGPTGSPTLLNCVAYKLCYYKFDQVQTEYGRPPGFDRARNRQVGGTNIVLTTMEEAFTSEHWIVRIYKVKKRPALDPAPGLTNAKLKKLKTAVKKKIEPKTEPKVKNSGESKPKQKTQKGVMMDKESNPSEPQGRYVGCVSSESLFSADKIYDGGPTGSQYKLALYHAFKNEKRYFAIARNVYDGHAFAFDTLSDKAVIVKGEGCERKCVDYESRKCGCVDTHCTGPTPQGENNNRRWAVYEIL